MHVKQGLHMGRIGTIYPCGPEDSSIRECSALDDIAFRQGILADPYGRSPWLFYADWLEENGRSILAERVRKYCSLRVQIMELPFETLPNADEETLFQYQFQFRRRSVMRWLFACLCVRYLPLPGGGELWDLLQDNSGRAVINYTELHALGLISAQDFRDSIAPMFAVGRGLDGLPRLGAHPEAQHVSRLVMQVVQSGESDPGTTRMSFLVGDLEDTAIRHAQSVGEPGSEAVRRNVTRWLTACLRACLEPASRLTNQRQYS